MLNKKGLMGKIIMILLAVIIIILVVTVWQAYSTIKVVTKEVPFITTSLTAIVAKGGSINQTDCEAIPLAEASISRLKAKIISSCRNPILSAAIAKMPQMAIKCKDVPTLESGVTQTLNQLKTTCANLDKTARTNATL